MPSGRAARAAHVEAGEPAHLARPSRWRRHAAPGRGHKRRRRETVPASLFATHDRRHAGRTAPAVQVDARIRHALNKLDEGN